MTKIIERIREAEENDGGWEAWAWYSNDRYVLPYWQAGVWVSLGRWELGVGTEVDPGGYFEPFEHRRWFTVSVGPVHFVLTRVKRNGVAATS